MHYCSSVAPRKGCTIVWACIIEMPAWLNGRGIFNWLFFGFFYLCVSMSRWVVCVDFVCSHRHFCMGSNPKQIGDGTYGSVCRAQHVQAGAWFITVHNLGIEGVVAAFVDWGMISRIFFEFLKFLLFFPIFVIDHICSIYNISSLKSWANNWNVTLTPIPPRTFCLHICQT